jgi:formylglycine-generating enzyme required for sulfatase activity
LAVGIGDRENAKASPKEKDMKIRNVYPWGTQWPPPSGAGNYAGEEAEVFGAGFSVIAGYRDDHPFTSPVGSYRANALGLQDLGGNVWEWVEDTWEPSSSSRVLRGASWGDYDRGGLWSSYRHLGVPTLRGTRIGFRVVLDVGEGER